MSRRARYSSVVLVLGFAGALGWAAWPRGSRLALRVSVPFKVNGKTVRIQLLAPTDWGEWDIHESATDAFLTCGPRERAPWLPAQIRSIFELGPEESAGMVVTVGVEVKVILKPGTYFKQQSFSCNPPAYLTYVRGNRAEFEATYRQICDSLRVIKDGSN